MTLKLLEDELHINWKMICQILHDYLEERKICMKFVPHSLTVEQKKHGVTTCENFTQTSQINQHFLNCIDTGDKCLVFM